MHIAYNENKIDLHAIIKVKVNDVVDGKKVNHMIETTVGRVLFNEFVPEEVGYHQRASDQEITQGYHR
ncbi:MAG: hypothetical protein MZV63_27675 [Marinilabiliales bacterium]|nr:hypothetical protein [Marinilabiliales bacterium]